MDIGLMDYFAGQALAGLLAGRVGAENICDFSDVRQGDTTETDQWAHTAYAIAEAMLRAREHEYWRTPNVEFSGGAPLYGAASAGTTG